eukprot:Hpha_TRINITY_DN14971_c5_g3::TRINITY_DN14971_c5_g3_i1::g.143953::m.143953
MGEGACALSQVQKGDGDREERGGEGAEGHFSRPRPGRAPRREARGPVRLLLTHHPYPKGGGKRTKRNPVSKPTYWPGCSSLLLALGLVALGGTTDRLTLTLLLLRTLLVVVIIIVILTAEETISQVERREGVTSEVVDGAGDQGEREGTAALVVLLRPLSDLLLHVLGVLREVRGGEKVEEGVARLGLGDHAGALALLGLLLLLLELDGKVLALLPVDLGAHELDEHVLTVVLIQLGDDLLSKHFVGEVGVVRELELELEPGVGVLLHLGADIDQVTEGLLVPLAHSVLQRLLVKDSSPPEVRDPRGGRSGGGSRLRTLLLDLRGGLDSLLTLAHLLRGRLRLPLHDLRAARVERLVQLLVLGPKGSTLRHVLEEQLLVLLLQALQRQHVLPHTVRQLRHELEWRLLHVRGLLGRLLLRLGRLLLARHLSLVFFLWTFAGIKGGQ